METSSNVPVDLAHKVCNVAMAQGYTLELLNALAQDPKLFGQLRQVQRGFAEIRSKRMFVDEYLPSQDDWEGN